MTIYKRRKETFHYDRGFVDVNLRDSKITMDEVYQLTLEMLKELDRTTPNNSSCVALNRGWFLFPSRSGYCIEAKIFSEPSEFGMTFQENDGASLKASGYTIRHIEAIHQM